MRTLRASLSSVISLSAASMLWLLGCGGAAPRPPGDQPAQPAEGPPAATVDADPSSSSLAGCPSAIRRAWAVQASESMVLLPRGGTTDAASVVLVQAYTAQAGAVDLLYQSGVADCARATFPGKVVMDPISSDPREGQFTGVIPAFPRGTHVCWKLSIEACGATLTSPPAGTPAFDYTTR